MYYQVQYYYGQYHAYTKAGKWAVSASNVEALYRLIDAHKRHVERMR